MENNKDILKQHPEIAIMHYSIEVILSLYPKDLLRLIWVARESYVNHNKSNLLQVLYQKIVAQQKDKRDTSVKELDGAYYEMVLAIFDRIYNRFWLEDTHAVKQILQDPNFIELFSNLNQENLHKIFNLIDKYKAFESLKEEARIKPSFAIEGSSIYDAKLVFPTSPEIDSRMHKIYKGKYLEQLTDKLSPEEIGELRAYISKLDSKTATEKLARIGGFKSGPIAYKGEMSRYFYELRSAAAKGLYYLIYSGSILEVDFNEFYEHFLKPSQNN